MNQLRWGFVGASTIARQYMFNAVGSDDRSCVRAIASSSGKRAQEFARQYGLEAAYDSIDALLDDAAIDVVYISTRNEFHCEQALATAAAGKHLLCEKPLALTVADAVAMCEACESANVLMGTNHHLRHAATITTMRRLVEQGSIGTPLAARMFLTVELPKHLQTWRVQSKQAGGVALDITVHDTDTLRYVLGDEIVEVTALAANQGLASDHIADAMMGVMRFANGVIASFHDAFTVPHAGTGLELDGTEGSLVGRGVLTQQPTGDVYLRRGETIEPVDIGPREDLYVRAVRQFNDAVLTGGTPSANGTDGIISLAVALAAAQSAATGRAVRISDPLTPST